MLPTLPIEDAKGEAHRYSVRLLPPGAFADWTVELVHQETGAAHGVSEYRGHWRCTCKAWECSRPPLKDCKHCRAAREWRAIADALNEQTKDGAENDVR